MLLDAMVVAAGLTSRREPASYSRQLIERAFDGEFELVVTEILLREVHDVLVDAKFVGRMSEAEAAVLIDALAEVAAVVVRDSESEFGRLTDDPDDDYLAHAALQANAFLVTRDDSANFTKVDGLRVGRPGTPLRLIGSLNEERTPSK